jgi:REP element-mobilizing transposase RayT
MKESPGHLRRLPRIFSSNPVFFLTITTKERKTILADEVLHCVCREVWKRSRTLYLWSTGPYVLMPDHVHFFASPLDDSEAKPLSHFVGKWKEWTSKNAKAVGFPDFRWQPEFFDHVVRSTESFREKVDYVWENPVRAGLVTKPEDWRFAGNMDDWIIS